MIIVAMKSKIHNAYVNASNNVNSDCIFICKKMMDSVGLIDGEQVHIINYANGERIITIVKENECPLSICVSGLLNSKIKIGDKIIIIAYSLIECDTKQIPKIIFPNFDNSF